MLKTFYFDLIGKKKNVPKNIINYNGYQLYINEDNIAHIYNIWLRKNDITICNAYRGHAGELGIINKDKEKTYRSIYSMYKDILSILKNEKIPLALTLEYINYFNKYLFSNYVKYKLYQVKGYYIIPFTKKTWTAKKSLDKQ